MTYQTTIELQKESMKFSAGHTTIFSATEREPLHGHTYRVYLALTTSVRENGMTFDYRYYKKRVHELCRYLNQTFLMPQFSPYLEYSEDEMYYYFMFHQKKMIFLKEDVTILPLVNVTVEELSRWFIAELVKASDESNQHYLHSMLIKVFSDHGQSGSHQWQRIQT